MHASLIHWKSTSQYFQYRGYSIFYKVEGTGTPLLLLHGFPTSSWDWSPLWDVLKAKYQLVTLDFIGFGLSDKPHAYNYSLVDQANLVEHLLQRLGISRYHILAHDIGDSIAQELLARQVDRQSATILSCCFLNGGLFPETHRPTRTQKLLLSPLGFLVSRLFNYRLFSKSFSIIFF
ncbi:MAG: alpha/beta fold hydrolase, partial [Flammeovirgaceae bacterium]